VSVGFPFAIPGLAFSPPYGARAPRLALLVESEWQAIVSILNEVKTEGKKRTQKGEIAPDMRP